MTAGAADLPSAEPPLAGPDSSETRRPLRILSLTGGGYRGMFSATVLTNLCKRTDRAVHRGTGHGERGFSHHQILNRLRAASPVPAS